MILTGINIHEYRKIVANEVAFVFECRDCADPVEDEERSLQAALARVCKFVNALTSINLCGIIKV